jgi:hypothetical protein
MDFCSSLAVRLTGSPRLQFQEFIELATMISTRILELWTVIFCLASLCLILGHDKPEILAQNKEFQIFIGQLLWELMASFRAFQPHSKNYSKLINYSLNQKHHAHSYKLAQFCETAATI